MDSDSLIQNHFGSWIEFSDFELLSRMDSDYLTQNFISWILYNSHVFSGSPTSSSEGRGGVGKIVRYSKLSEIGADVQNMYQVYVTFNRNGSKWKVSEKGTGCVTCNHVKEVLECQEIELYQLLAHFSGTSHNCIHREYTIILIVEFMSPPRQQLFV